MVGRKDNCKRHSPRCLPIYYNTQQTDRDGNEIGPHNKRRIGMRMKSGHTTKDELARIRTGQKYEIFEKKEKRKKKKDFFFT